MSHEMKVRLEISFLRFVYFFLGGGVGVGVGGFWIIKQYTCRKEYC